MRRVPRRQSRRVLWVKLLIFPVLISVYSELRQSPDTRQASGTLSQTGSGVCEGLFEGVCVEVGIPKTDYQNALKGPSYTGFRIVSDRFPDP
jgi:hypothetical protein